MLATFAIGASGIENQSGPRNSMTHGPPSEDANMHKIELLSFKMLHYTVVQKIPDPCYICKYLQQILVTHTHTHTRLTALFPGLPG